MHILRIHGICPVLSCNIHSHSIIPSHSFPLSHFPSLAFNPSTLLCYPFPFFSSMHSLSTIIPVLASSITCSLPCLVLFCLPLVFPSLVLFCFVLICFVLFCFVLSSLVFSRFLLFCLALYCFVLSYRISSYLTLPWLCLIAVDAVEGIQSSRVHIHGYRRRG